MSDSNTDEKPKSPLAQPAPWDLVSHGYEKHTREFLAQFAELALRRVDISPKTRVVDVACGPGTSVLLLAPRVEHVDAVDFSPKMLDQCRRNLEAREITNVSVTEGNGMALPLKDSSYDLGLSMFGLMFFTDRVQGMRELFRVLRPGGRVIIGSWGSAARSPLMAELFDALRVLEPSIPPPVPDIANHENPEVLRAELETAGFSEVHVEEVECPLHITDIRAFWTSMAEGSVPIVLMRERFSTDEWHEREQAVLAHLSQRLTLPTSLSSFANIGYGAKV